MISEMDSLGAMTTYEYDPKGRLIRVTDANGISESYTYDLAGRRISTVNELELTQLTKYDARGLIIVETDACSTVTSRTHRWQYQSTPFPKMFIMIPLSH